jgi:hypothetical protein
MTDSTNPAEWSNVNGGRASTTQVRAVESVSYSSWPH